MLHFVYRATSLVLVFFSALILALLQSCGGSGSSGGGGGGGGNLPSAPTGLTATAGNTQVSLSWTASSGATSYHVKRGTATGGPYSQAGAATAAGFTDTGLTNGTKYYYVVAALNANGESANSSEVNATPSGPVTNISVTIDPTTDRHTISPYIYGAAYPKDAATVTDSGLSVVRWGGNATSTYNWQLFTYNADNDYFFEDFAANGFGNNTDGDSTQFIKDVKIAGSNPLMTMVMLPWVAKTAEVASPPNGHWSYSVAKYGAQCSVDQYNTDAGNGILTGNCGGTTYITNDPNDAYFQLLDDHSGSCVLSGTCVYRSDWAAALAAAFGSGTCYIPYFSITSCHYYDMDNEIDIWNGTHRDIHPNATTYDELSSIYLTEASKLKIWDPHAVRLGWVSCCWYYYWNTAAGGPDKSAHANIDFMPWWLNQVAWSDAVSGARTLDIFDVHAYPETSSNGLTEAQIEALTLRSTRDWWDPTYTSEAWFGTNSVTTNQPLDGRAFRIPRLRAWANTIYPGTPVALTEWNFQLGADSAFYSALADADAYGILGRERVSLSTRWTAPDPANPNYLALKLYTNYDGAHHGFAPISVSATHNADPGLFSVFAAVTADGKTTTIMVVNKDPVSTASVSFQLTPTPTAVSTYTLSATNPNSIVAASPGWTSTMSFAPYSVTLLVASTSLAVPQSDWDLNPDAIVLPAGGSVTLNPAITGGTTNISLGNATSDNGISVAIANSTVTTTQNGSVTISAPSGTAPGFYHFTVTGSDSSPWAKSGWAIVTTPAASITKTGDNQSGGSLVLKATLVPGASGGTAGGANIFFTTDKGTLSQRIVTTDGSGNASVTLTLPSGSGTAHVTAEGPYGLGHPVQTFTESN